MKSAVTGEYQFTIIRADTGKVETSPLIKNRYLDQGVALMCGGYTPDYGYSYANKCLAAIHPAGRPSPGTEPRNWVTYPAINLNNPNHNSNTRFRLMQGSNTEWVNDIVENSRFAARITHTLVADKDLTIYELIGYSSSHFEHLQDLTFNVFPLSWLNLRVAEGGPITLKEGDRLTAVYTLWINVSNLGSRRGLREQQETMFDYVDERGRYGGPFTLNGTGTLNTRVVEDQNTHRFFPSFAHLARSPIDGINGVTRQSVYKDTPNKDNTGTFIKSLRGNDIAWRTWLADPKSNYVFHEIHFDDRHAIHQTTRSVPFYVGPYVMTFGHSVPKAKYDFIFTARFKISFVKQPPEPAPTEILKVGQQPQPTVPPQPVVPPPNPQPELPPERTADIRIGVNDYEPNIDSGGGNYIHLFHNMKPGARVISIINNPVETNFDEYFDYIKD